MGNIRIIGGEWRGRLLDSPKGRRTTRPTLGRVREALFNIIRDEIPDAVFADFYAGTGAVGIEALSRGAEHSIFVESDRHALNVLESNIAKVGAATRCSVIKGGVGGCWEKIVARTGGSGGSDKPALASGRPIDILFADPPYGKRGEPALPDELARLLRKTRKSSEAPVLAPKGLIVLQAVKGAIEPTEEAVEGLKLLDRRRYGETELLFLTLTREADE